MSNHHPQPPYGTMYSSNPPVVSSTTASFPGMQQYHHQPQAYNPYWQSQSLSNGMSFALNTNGYAHHANAQGANPPALSGGVVQEPYGGYANAAQYSTAPTHFHTAVPNSAYAATPYTPQPLVSSNHHMSQEAVINNPPSPQPSPAAPVVNFEGPEAAKNPSPELEDGELSSGELSNSMDDFYAETTGMGERPPHEPTQLFASELEKTNHRDSFDSFDSVNHTSGPSDISTKAPTVQGPLKLPPSMREQAQAILRELHSYKIGFQDLANEGFEAGLLRGLYAEINTPMLSLEEQKQQHGDMEASNPAESAMSTQKSNIRKSEDLSGKDVSGPNFITKDSRTNDLMETSVTLNSIDEANAASPKNIGPTKDLRVSGTGKSAAKTPASKPVDRKEYIARLMAAKSGKPLPSSESEAVLRQVPSDEKKSASRVGIFPPNDAEATTPPNVTKEPTAPVMQPSQVQKEKLDFEAKKKAQTELARQKMEALRNQKMAQQQEAQLASVKAPDTHSESLVVETSVSTALSSSESQPQAQVPTSTEGRQGSYFSPGSLKPAFSIPGLFTASQDSNLQTHMKLPNTASSPKAPQSIHNADAADVIADHDEGPRKRQKAADFMNSTSTTLLKSLSHGEDTGVIIDISDDDADDDPEDRLGHQSLSADKARLGTAPNSGFRSENDEKYNGERIPAPPGLAASRSTQDFANSTPSVSNTPGKAQEPQELKTKEIEIETMNRKILELEQRIKTKQAASRAQSPRVHVTSASNNGVANRRSPAAAPPRVDTATEEQLLREKEKQEDKLATAEAEQFQMAKSEQQKAAPKHLTHEKPIRPIESQGPRQDSDVRQSTLQAERRSETSDEAPRQRLTLLEAELSALDTSMTRLQEMLQQSKLELERVENDLRIKADRKKLLQQELVSLSHSVQMTREALPEQQQPHQQPPPDRDIEAEREDVTKYADVNGASDPLDTPGPQVIPTSSTDLPPTGPINFESETQSVESVNRGGIGTFEAAEEPKLADAMHSTSPQINEQLDLDQSSEGELEEDNMDISGSDVDEGHVLETHQEPASKPEDVMDVTDDEDVYEPPSQIGSMQQSVDRVVDNQGQIFDRVHQHQSSEIAATTLTGDQVDETMTGAIEDTRLPRRYNGEQTLNGGSAQPSTKEEDDYEPPEPESFTKEDSVALLNKIPDLDSAENQPAETADENEPLTPKTATKDGHFIPYESPLKQFASYRFHPEYRNEVPGGYRSLTYSHNIRPEVPICQYELGGGVCNDDSCTNQHFQKMALPDHLILGAMGKGEGSTPEEKETYINGLRSLIFDLRKREIKDLDAIAEAIAQYRLKFLDDASKVLSL